MRVYEAMGEALRRLDVNAVFGLMGDGNMRFISHAADTLGLAYYGAHHENSAVAMADGYARVSNRVGVCTVTQGPGVTNAMSALGEAVKAGTPLVLLAGETPARMPMHHQYIDQPALFAAVGAGIQKVRAAGTVALDITRAYNRAMLESRPIAVSVPNDLLMQDCPDQSLQRVGAVPVPRSCPEAQALQTLHGMVAQSKRPLILAGRGAVRSEARHALEALGDRIGALLATTVHAKGFFSGHRFDAGVTGGFASEAACRLIGKADLVLAFGASLPVFATRNREIFAASAKIVQVDTRATAIGAQIPADYGVVGDVGATAGALLAELELSGFQRSGFRSAAFANDIDALHAPAAFRDESDGKTVDPRALMARLDRMLPVERTVVVDSGHAMGWSVQHLSVPDGQGFIFGNDFMVVGLGVAAAMGAAVARPDRLTVAAPGDGGLSMSIGELETLVRYDIPLLVLAINDAGFGVEVHILRHYGQPPTQALFTDTDFAAVGRAFGTQGLTVRSPEDLDGLKGWLAAPCGPMVVDCKVNPAIMGEWFKENLSPASWLVRMMSH
jgi:thiamine pyrophosphate-dependent acetolactate synthase large subunit-like protein